MTPPGRGDGDDGFIAAEAVLAMAITLVLVTGFANLFIHRYAQGVITLAANEAAHAWANSGGTRADCHNTADAVLADLLDGPVATNITITCTTTGNTIRAAATGTLTSIGPIPDSTIDTSAIAVTEPEHGLEPA